MVIEEHCQIQRRAVGQFCPFDMMNVFYNFVQQNKHRFLGPSYITVATKHQIFAVLDV